LTALAANEFFNFDKRNPTDEHRSILDFGF